MIVGAVSAGGKAARRVLDRLTDSLDLVAGGSPDSDVIVAASRWLDTPPATLTEDAAYVGTLRGERPRPHIELRGDFAMVARAGSLLRLARGRYCGRPLFWVTIGEVTVACNRLVPLAFLAHSQLQLNIEHILAPFDTKYRQFYSPLPFVGFHQVAANTVIDLDARGRAEVHRAPVRFERPLTMGTQMLARELRTEFEAAVARQTAGARRVAVMVSGGVDSSNLFGIAVHNARHRGGPEAVPICLDSGGPGDDRPHLQALCAHVGARPVRVSPKEGAQHVGRHWVVDGSVNEVGPGSTVIPLIERAKDSGSDLAVFGLGSEHALDAAPEVFGDFLLTHPIRALWCAARVRTIKAASVQPWRFFVAGPLFRHFAPQSLQELRARRTGYHRIGTQHVRDHNWMKPRLAQFVAERKTYPRAPPILSQSARVAAMANDPLLASFSDYASRWEAQLGVTIRFPYLDDDFLRFVGRLPSGTIFAGARERGLLRESMKGLVPDTLRYRMDKGRGDEALVELFSAAGGFESVRNLANLTELERMGLVDGKDFVAAFERFAEDPQRLPWWRADPLWAAISAEAFMRWFRDFRSRSFSRLDEVTHADAGGLAS